MFFKSIKEINRLMTYPKFWFSKFKKFVSSGQSLGGKFASSGQSLGSYNSRRYRWILRNYDVLKRKILEFCWDNKIKKNEMELKMYSVLNTLSEYTYFYMSKNITSYIFLLVFKIVESLQCILNSRKLISILF